MGNADYDKFCEQYSDAELAHMMRHVMLTRPSVAAEAEKALAAFMADYADSYCAKYMRAAS